MQTIGVYLKNLRATKNIGLEEIADETKIKYDHLEDLENDRLSDLPRDIYVKGFIKNYLKVLSMPETEGLQIYREQKKALKGGLSVLSNKLEDIIYRKVQ